VLTEKFTVQQNCHTRKNDSCFCQEGKDIPKNEFLKIQDFANGKYHSKYYRKQNTFSKYLAALTFKSKPRG
jgi:hypothetical protein